MAWRSWAAFGLMALASCERKGSAGTVASASASAPSKVASSAPEPRAPLVSSTNSPALAAPSTSALAARAPGRPPSKGEDACRPLRGPIQLSFTGAATVWPSEDGGPEQDPHIVFNRDGAPKPVTLPAAPLPRAASSTSMAAAKPSASAAKKERERSERLALAEPAERATSPGCALAGSYLFCMAKSGDIHRSTRNGDGDVVLAKGRPGTPIAASTIGASSTAYAFLADRKTSEGVVSLAFAGLDEGAPLQISEEGSGATFVALAPRGEQVVAMYIDARRAMTPLHARVLSAAAGRVRLGNDAVLFVGEGSETRLAGALALGESGPAFGLLPGFKDATTFGVAAIRIDEQPRDDAPVTWSTYPSGMDHAAIAATRGVSPRRVLLSRPASNEPKANKVLELGEIEESGAFKALCTVAEGQGFADLGLTADRFGTLWLTYTDAEGTWIERRGKPF